MCAELYIITRDGNKLLKTFSAVVYRRQSFSGVVGRGRVTSVLFFCRTSGGPNTGRLLFERTRDRSPLLRYPSTEELDAGTMPSGHRWRNGGAVGDQTCVRMCLRVSSAGRVVQGQGVHFGVEVERQKYCYKPSYCMCCCSSTTIYRGLLYLLGSRTLEPLRAIPPVFANR